MIQVCPFRNDTAIQSSNENKHAPGCVGDVGDEIPPGYVGILEKSLLGGVFGYFLFSPLFGEDSHFD